MATEYFKVDVTFAYSTKADYSSPVVKRTLTYEYTGDEYAHWQEAAASGTAPSTGGTNVPLSTGGLAYLIVKNLDETNYVDVAFKTAANGSTVNIHRLYAGGVMALTDISYAYGIGLFGNGAACQCEIIVAGS